MQFRICYQFLRALAADSRLDKTALRLLTYYASRQNDKTGLTWASLETIERDTGIGSREVKRHRKMLVEYGWLTFRSSTASGIKRYTITIPNALAVLPTSAQKTDTTTSLNGGHTIARSAATFSAVPVGKLPTPLGGTMPTLEAGSNADEEGLSSPPEQKLLTNLIEQTPPPVRYRPTPCRTTSSAPGKDYFAGLEMIS